MWQQTSPHCFRINSYKRHSVWMWRTIHFTYATLHMMSFYMYGEIPHAYERKWCQCGLIVDECHSVWMNKEKNQLISIKSFSSSWNSWWRNIVFLICGLVFYWKSYQRPFYVRFTIVSCVNLHNNRSQIFLAIGRVHPILWI